MRDTRSRAAGYRQARAWWLTAGLLLCCIGQAWSAPAAGGVTASTAPATNDAANQLVALIHAPTLAQQPTEMVSRYAKQKADIALKAHPDLNPRQQQQLAQLPERVRDVVTRNLKWDALLDAYAAIYRRVYSPAEIQAQLRFFQSKEGQAVLSKQLQLNSQLMLQTNASFKSAYTLLQKTIDEQVQTIVAPATAASAP